MEDSSLVALSFPYCHDKHESILISISFNVIFLWKFLESALWRNFMMLKTNVKSFFFHSVENSLDETMSLGKWPFISSLMIYSLISIILCWVSIQILNFLGWFPYPPILYFIIFFFLFYLSFMDCSALWDIS